MYAAESSMGGGEAEGCFSSEEEVCNFMPFELSYSHSPFSLRVFWSKQDNELQSILPSSFSSVDISTFQNETTKEKIKVFLQSLHPRFSELEEDCLFQFWAPVRIADKIYLSTADQPFALYGLHRGLCSYRRDCLENILIPVYVDQLGGEEYNLHPPGRVFRHGSPELCNDIMYYLSEEYAPRDRAVQLSVRSYVAFPLFESAGQHCIGVLEHVSASSGHFGRWEHMVYSLSRELQGTDLTIERFPLRKNIYDYENRQAAEKISRVMEDTYWRHQLPVALMWVAQFNKIYLKRVYRAGSYTSYYSDEIHRSYFDFTCLPMREGQGVVGKAFSSQSACFCKDVSKLSMNVYPLVTVARELELSGCFAICLKSTRVNHLYVLEFFLPRSVIDFGDLRAFVTELVAGLKKDIRKSKNSIQKIGRRLFVEVIKISSEPDDLNSFDVCASGWRPSVSKHRERSKMMQHDSLHQQVGDTNDAWSNSCAKPTDVLESTQLEVRLTEQGKTPGEPLMEPNITTKERNITHKMQCDVEIPARVKWAIRTLDVERGITLEVLQQHSRKKLKDVANILGVSRSTLKRICRKYKIYRWPPNRSNRPIHQDPVCPTDENTDAHTMPSTITMQKCSNILVKITYGEAIWKFPLSLSAKKIDLEQQVAKRLNSSVGNFKINYLDEENEWISVSCDEDLKFSMSSQLASIGIMGAAA